MHDQLHGDIVYVGYTKCALDGFQQLALRAFYVACPAKNTLCCRSGSRNTSHRLHVFADCLRVVFNSSQAAAPGLPPAHLGYKVHVHMEKSKVKCCPGTAQTGHETSEA